MDNEQIAELTLAHLNAAGLDDIFKPPLLNEPLETRLLIESERFRAELRRSIVQFLRNPRHDGFQPLVKLKIPKTRHAYRHASLVDVVDLVRYTALVIRLAPVIEAHRIPDDLNVVFSSRFRSEAPFFGIGNGYDRFRQASQQLSDSGIHSIKVITDISSFYDRLNIHRLETSLIDIGCNENDRAAVNQILLHWAGRNSYGLPVGCDASRLLAEAVLISVDNALAARKIPFVRYVDDYRIFASSYAEAHSHLNVLINALDREGLFINSEKTRVLECDRSDEPAVGDEAAPAKDFDAIDENEKVAFQVRTGRYATKISTYYREPGKAAIAKLRQEDADNLLPGLTISNAAEEDLRYFVRVFIYGTSHNPETLIAFVSRHIHMLGFVVSALIKESGRLSKDVRDRLSASFEELYGSLAETDYYRLCIARLLSNENYYRSGVFGRWFNSLRPDANPIFIRELICFFSGSFTRDEILQLVNYSNAGCHIGVCRAIVAAALAHNTARGEKTAWANVWVGANRDAYVLSACRDFLHQPKT